MNVTPPLPRQAMAASCRHPLIFPLSAASPECSAEDAYRATDGRALVATEQRVRAGGGQGGSWGDVQQQGARCHHYYVQRLA